MKFNLNLEVKKKKKLKCYEMNKKSDKPFQKPERLSKNIRKSKKVEIIILKDQGGRLSKIKSDDHPRSDW